MKKLITTISVLFGLMGASFAQDHVVKLNVPALGLGNVYGTYEYVITDKMSASLGASYMFNRKIPFLGMLDMDPSNKVQYLKMNGYSITPEFRYYLGDKGRAQGLYAAPYFRYSNYDLAGTYVDNNVEYENGGFIKSIGGGLGVGYQWLLGDRIAIDLNAGLGYMGNDIEYNVTSEDASANYPAQLGNLQEMVDLLGDPEVEVTASSAKATFKKASFMPRFGFSVGYAF